MKAILSAIFWVSVYLLLALAPLVVLKTGERLPGSGFWWDFSMALAFAGMAMMGIQFFLTARFRRASAPFGIDIIYYFHRFLAVLAFALIFLHFLIIRIDNADALGALNPLQAPWYMTAGRVALGLFALLIITSLWRKPLRIHYDGWRILHTDGAYCISGWRWRPSCWRWGTSKVWVTTSMHQPNAGCGPDTRCSGCY